jgi:hypothetical protein
MQAALSATGTVMKTRVLRFLQSLAVLGLLAPCAYLLLEGDMPVAVEMLLLVTVILGFLSTIVWLFWLKTWHAIFPMLFILALFLPAVLSFGGIAHKFDLDAVRDQVLQQLGATDFVVQKSSYVLPAFDPAGTWQIALSQAVASPKLGLADPNINFSLCDPGILKIKNADGNFAQAQQEFCADTHFSPLCALPGHCSITLTHSTKSNIIHISVSEF